MYNMALGRLTSMFGGTFISHLILFGCRHCSNITVLVVPLIWTSYIPSTLHSEQIYGTTSNGTQYRKS